MLLKQCFRSSLLLSLALLVSCKGSDYTFMDVEAVHKTNANIEVSFRVGNAANGDAPDMKKFNLNKVLKIHEDGQLISNSEGNKSSISSPKKFNVDVLLVIDLSASVAENGGLEQIKKAATSFVMKTLDGNKNGREMRISIRSFDGDDELKQVTSFSSNRKALEFAITGLTPGDDPSTNLNGALVKSYQVMKEHSVPGDMSDSLKKKAIVFFTDGKDQAARVSDSAALEAVRSARKDFGDLVYAVAVGNELSEGFLSNFGTKEKGYFVIDRFNKLTNVFETISSKLHGYADSYFVARICSPKRKGIHYMTLKMGDYSSQNIEFSANEFTKGCNVADEKQWENGQWTDQVWKSALLTNAEMAVAKTFYARFTDKNGFLYFKEEVQKSEAKNGWVLNYSPFGDTNVACHLYIPAESAKLDGAAYAKVIDYRSYNATYDNGEKFIGVQMAAYDEVRKSTYFVQCRTLQALNENQDLVNIELDFN